MKYILDIGSYNRFGKFTSSEWVVGLSILKTQASYLVIYSSQDIYMVFGNSICADISQLYELGETCGYKAYRVFPADEKFWVEFQSLRFHPDNGVSHSYVYNKHGACICSMEVDEEVNYLFFDNLDAVQVMTGYLVENHQISTEVIDHITEILGDDDWKELILV